MPQQGTRHVTRWFINLRYPDQLRTFLGLPVDWLADPTPCPKERPQLVLHPAGYGGASHARISGLPRHAASNFLFGLADRCRDDILILLEMSRHEVHNREPYPVPDRWASRTR